MKSMRIFLSLMILPAIISAQGIQASRTTPLTPEQEKAAFKLADGFVVELVASEENGIINPIDMTFDDQGRLWTQTAKMYPLDPVTGINFGKAMGMMRDTKLIASDPRFQKIKKLYTLEERGRDEILIIEDPTKQAQGPLKTWASGLTIPQSIMPYKNGCFVAHGSELFFLSDENNDGQQDKMTPVLSGFGFFDTHTMSHSLVRGPGGWINLSHGAINSGMVKAVKSGKTLDVTFSKNVRFSTDGKEIELVNYHRDNNWGYQVRANGQWHSTSANDGGYSVFPSESQSSVPGVGGQKTRSYAPFMPRMNNFRVGGTGISGLAFSEDGENGFPKQWENVAFLANPITGSINCVRTVRHPDGRIESQLLPNLLVSEDKWFRPVNIEFGPDGCLYVADWYNKIISHNEVSTDHPDRDRKHGRIWRIRHKSQKPFPIANVAKAVNSQLIKHLIQGKTQWEKRAAWHQIEERQAVELSPQLMQVAKDMNQPKENRILALWSLESLKHFDQPTIAACIKGADGDVRREAIRSLASYDLSAQLVASLVKNSINDANAMVRSQVLRTLDEIHEANDDTIALLIEACKPAAPNNNYGGNYERNFERFLARKALERYTGELKSYLANKDINTLNPSHLLWAVQALPSQDVSKFFVKLWGSASSNEGIDANTFIAISHILDSKEVQAAIAPSFKTQPKELLNLALENIDKININNISKFYTADIEKGLNSQSSMERSRALDLILKLHTPRHSKSLIKLIKENGIDIDKAIEALGNSNDLSYSVYKQLFFKKGLNFQQKLALMAACVIKNQNEAILDCQNWFPYLNESQKRQLVKRLSYSPQGNNLLKHFWEISYLNDSDWDYDSAHRTMSIARGDWRGKDIFNSAKNQHEKQVKKRQDLVESLKHSFANKTGNIQQGQALFQLCLTCHKVGDQGQNIAPPLDGSANREVDHLLTAIIKPDEAVEGVYGLYSVTRKDGSFIEGYLKKRDAKGVWIAKMGGHTTFIPSHKLYTQAFVNKRSFMPSSFGEMGAQSLADLIAYIKTLK